MTFHQLVRLSECVRRYVRSSGIQNGVFDALEMIDLVYAFRSWENDGHYAAWAHERVWDRLGSPKTDWQQSTQERTLGHSITLLRPC